MALSLELCTLHVDVLYHCNANMKSCRSKVTVEQCSAVELINNCINKKSLLLLFFFNYETNFQ